METQTTTAAEVRIGDLVQVPGVLGLIPGQPYSPRTPAPWRRVVAADYGDTEVILAYDNGRIETLGTGTTVTVAAKPNTLPGLEPEDVITAQYTTMVVVSADATGEVTSVRVSTDLEEVPYGVTVNDDPFHPAIEEVDLRHVIDSAMWPSWDFD